jgi:polyhydroxyalkanoate synthesis regulator phasin
LVDITSDYLTAFVRKRRKAGASGVTIAIDLTYLPAPRAERGVSLKARGSAEYHIRERGDVSTAEARRFAQAAVDLRRGETEAKSWEVAMAARRRDVLKELARNAAALRDEGDVELAEQVERFARELPPLDTERRRMQRALVEQVNTRLQRQQTKISEPPDHQRDS